PVRRGPVRRGLPPSAPPRTRHASASLLSPCHTQERHGSALRWECIDETTAPPASTEFARDQISLSRCYLLRLVTAFPDRRRVGRLLFGAAPERGYRLPGCRPPDVSYFARAQRDRFTAVACGHCEFVEFADPTRQSFPVRGRKAGIRPGGPAPGN